MRTPIQIAVIALLGLGACSTPLTETSYPVQAVLDVDGRDVFVRSRFDPFQRSWYTEVLPRLGTDQAIGREDAVRVVEEVWGPELCEGLPLRVETRFYSIWADPEAVVEYPTRGGWQVVADCDGQLL
ncbi:MAG: hypothetical protein AAFU49_19325 [Pseudomonadota bacterium]